MLTYIEALATEVQREEIANYPGVGGIAINYAYGLTKSPEPTEQPPTLPNSVAYHKFFERQSEEPELEPEEEEPSYYVYPRDDNNAEENIKTEQFLRNS